MLESYQGAVISLLGHDNYPGLSRDELELFRAHFGTAAFTCRWGSCPRATLGFEAERVRFEHEMSHVRYFPCTFPGCRYPPFPSGRSLKNHMSKYHTPVIARKAIRKTESGNARHDQQEAIIAPPLTSENQDSEMVGNANETQPHDRPPSANTTEHPTVSVPDNQDPPSQLQSTYFLSTDTLDVADLTHRGWVLYKYFAGQDINDNEKLVAAAAFGHHELVSELIYICNADPDPDALPASQVLSEFSRPILAAIGGPNLEVLRLIAEHPRFDPTRLFCGETYAEISKRRRGIRWREESHILSSAYRDYKRKHKQP